jgi:hypothetical protein
MFAGRVGAYLWCFALRVGDEKLNKQMLGGHYLTQTL